MFIISIVWKSPSLHLMIEAIMVYRTMIVPDTIEGSNSPEPSFCPRFLVPHTRVLLHSFVSSKFIHSSNRRIDETSSIRVESEAHHSYIRYSLSIHLDHYHEPYPTSLLFSCFYYIHSFYSNCISILPHSRSSIHRTNNSLPILTNPP